MMLRMAIRRVAFPRMIRTHFLFCCAAVSIVVVSWAGAQNGRDFDQGAAEFRAGDYSAAAKLFAQAERAAPGKTSALLYEAKCLVHLQNFTAAEDALRKYLAFYPSTSYPSSSDAFYLLGFVLNRQDRPVESLKIYSQAAAITPPTGDDLKIVGLDYVLLDDYSDAIHWLEKAVERDAANVDAWYYLGRAYYTTGRREQASKAFLKVLDLDPHNVKAKNNLGLILETDGETEAAIDAYRTALAWQEHSSHPSEQPYVNLGNLLMAQGQTKEALALLETAATLAPNNAYCHLSLGMAYRQVGRQEAAQHELERATQIEPSNARAHYQLGRIYKEAHDLDRAQVEFKKTADLESQSARAKTPQE
jgi:tetratricopeptide (TPR) repeat protein